MATDSETRCSHQSRERLREVPDATVDYKRVLQEARDSMALTRTLNATCIQIRCFGRY